MPAWLTDVADNWSSIYSNSAALRSGVMFVHIGGLVWGGGLALAADRAMLAAHRAGVDAVRREADRLGGVHGVVIASMAAVLVTGVLLMLADLDAYLASTAFWTKMALVALLVANGALLRRSGQLAAAGSSSAHRLLLTAARLSLVLWPATILAGVVLPNAL
jgi:hypothetical protein